MRDNARRDKNPNIAGFLNVSQKRKVKFQGGHSKFEEKETQNINAVGEIEFDENNLETHPEKMEMQ